MSEPGIQLPRNLVLRTVLVLRNMTQTELSYDARMSTTRISELINGRNRCVVYKEKRQLARALDIPVETLFPGEDPQEIRAALVKVLGITRRDLPS